MELKGIDGRAPAFSDFRGRFFRDVVDGLDGGKRIGFRGGP
jgi:hypothetical protein